MTDAWIHMVGEDEAAGELADHYARVRDPATGGVDNILRISASTLPRSSATWRSTAASCTVARRCHGGSGR